MKGLRRSAERSFPPCPGSAVRRICNGMYRAQLLRNEIAADIRAIFNAPDRG
jgi:hypothetical protein